MTDDRKLNTKLLRNLVRWARGESNRLDKKFAKLGEFDWQQQDWAKQEKNGICKTAFCMAGAAVVMNGYKFDWNEWNGSIAPDYRERTAEYCYPKGDKRHTQLVSEAACDLLGIYEDEAERLFDADNDIEQIERVARDICESRGKKLKL